VGGFQSYSGVSALGGVADSTTSNIDLVNPAGMSQHALDSMIDMADTERRAMLRFVHEVSSRKEAENAAKGGAESRITAEAAL
jgi:hypothetical protein